MYLIKKIYLLVTGFSFLGSVYSQHKTHAFSVNQCVDYAVKNNFDLKNAALGVQKQLQQNKEITAAALPSVSGTAVYTGYFDIPVQSISDFISPGVYGVLTAENVKNGATGNTITAPGNYGTIAAQFSTRHNANVGLQLHQVLFDGQVFAGLQARTTSVLYQQNNQSIILENIKLQLYKSYYRIVAANTEVLFLDANIERLRKLKHDASVMYKNGFAEKLDIDKASVQLTNMQTVRQNTMNSITISYLNLKMLMGMPLQDTLVLTDSITENLISEEIIKPLYLDYEKRPDFQGLKLLEKLNRYNIKRYRLSSLPSLSLIGSYSKMAQRNCFNIFNSGTWFTTSYIGINLSVPIFSGFSNVAKIKQAQLDLRQTENSIDRLKISIDNEVMQAKLNFTSAISSINNQKENLKLAESIYTTAKKKFEMGIGSSSEITTAQTDLLNAQSNYMNALYAAIAAKIDYLKATGNLFYE